jgi:subtilisin family serine protease
MNINSLIRKLMSYIIIIVVVAAGNEGDMGIFSIGQPSTASNAFSVASVDNGFHPVKELTATGIERSITYSSDNDEALKDGAIVVGDKNPSSTSQGCTAASIDPAVKGKIALIQRGSCNFADKANNAAAAGAVGVAIYNNVEGPFAASVPGVNVPVISLTNADGKELLDAIKKGEVVLKFNKKGSLQPIDTVGTVSSFSSLGASAELYLKPNIAGIGGNVYSTLPRYHKSWGMMSGTSMACPYVAGSIALYLNSEGKSDQSVQYINEHFQNYASPTKVFKSTDIDSPVRQGAGLIQVYDTILQKSHVTPAQISFNDTSSTNYKTHTITVTNHGSDIISYEVVNDVSTAISPYDVKKSGYTPLEPVKNSVAAAKLRFSTKSFKLGPGKSTQIKVTVTPPNTDPKDHVFYGGFIRIKSNQQDKAKDLKVPYFGVVGVQKTLPIFDKGFPTIIDLQDKEYSQKDTFIYDRSKKDSFPVIVLRLLTPSAKIKAELVDAKTNKVLGEFVYGLNYLGRNFLVEGYQFTQLIWDGTFIPPAATKRSTAPAGTYFLRFTALKSLGNPKDTKDWETWTSGPIALKN